MLSSDGTPFSTCSFGQPMILIFCNLERLLILLSMGQSIAYVECGDTLKHLQIWTAEDTNLVRSAEASGPLGLGAEGHVKLDN